MQPTNPIHRPNEAAAPPTLLSQQHIQSFTGPIPAPETLREYDTVMPGLAERIVKMAENQQAHRQELEKTAFQTQADEFAADRAEKRRGQHWAGAVCLTDIVGGCLVAAFASGAAGAAIVGVGLAGIVTAFIYGRKHPEPKTFSADKSADGDEPAKS